MEMKENNQKKVLLSVLGVAILVVAVVGISFAIYSTSFETDANSISTGTVMVSYTEPTNAINITDALPIADATGKALSGANKTFDFTVATHASNALTIPYVVTLTPDTNNTITDAQVKVYLTKDATDVLAPTKVSALAADATRTTSKKLYDGSDKYTATGEASKTSKFVLRMWVADDVDAATIQGKTYKAKVNVDSNVTPIQ